MESVKREKKDVSFDKFIVLTSNRLLVKVTMNHVKDEDERKAIFDEIEEAVTSIGFGWIDLIISDKIFNENYRQVKP